MHITDTCKDYLHLQNEFLKKNGNFEKKFQSKRKCTCEFLSFHHSIQSFHFFSPLFFLNKILNPV